MGIVNAAKAWVASATEFIQQKPIFLRPGHSLVKTDPNRVMIPAGLGIGVGEQQNVAIATVLPEIKPTKAAATSRFDKRLAIGNMRGPSLTKVTSCGNGAELDSVFGSHVQHERAITKFNCLALAVAYGCWLADLPVGTMIVTGEQV